MDYREVLRQELEKRKGTNPGYSLRAFARDLSLAPSTLSEILKCKSGLSQQKAVQIAPRLHLSAAEQDRFVVAVAAQHARTEVERRGSAARLRELSSRRRFEIMKLNAFEVVANWHHMALLELLRWKGSAPQDRRWLAAQLGITPVCVEEALERLRSVNLVRKVPAAEGEEERWEVTDEHTTTLDDVPSRAVRNCHRQILERAIAALEGQSVEEREISSLVMAVTRDQIPKAKRLIREFQDRFSQELQLSADSSADDVVALSVQFFSLLNSTRKV